MQLTQGFLVGNPGRTEKVDLPVNELILTGVIIPFSNFSEFLVGISGMCHVCS